MVFNKIQLLASLFRIIDETAHPFQKLDHNMRIYAKGDEVYSLPSLDVFAMAIKYLKDHCLEYLKQAGR